MLDYDGESEAEDKHLWTEEEFGDFVLIVDARRPRKPQPAQVPVLLPAEVLRGATPPVGVDGPPGRWSRFVITAVGDTVTVVLNGKTVIDKARLPVIPKKGPIALQHHGDPIQFANIYIKELD